jgi:hypothetical protein
MNSIYSFESNDLYLLENSKLIGIFCNSHGKFTGPYHVGFKINWITLLNIEYMCIYKVTKFKMILVNKY